MIDDGTSVSWGRSNGGKLLNPVKLPRRGDGYRVPARWVTRGVLYGTDEMVAMIAHVGREISRKYPKLAVGVADLSPRRGGRSAWHRSHQTGRDVDMLFFAVDGKGRPVMANNMLHFRRDGSTVLEKDSSGKVVRRIHFDLERNWFLVRTLLENPIATVQYIFVYDPLRQALLDHAIAVGEPAAIIEQASIALLQPGDSAPHDDHFHVRIYCAPSDRAIGCSDRGSLRWTKKDRKYERFSPHIPHRVRKLLTSERRATLSRSSMLFR